VIFTCPPELDATDSVSTNVVISEFTATAVRMGFHAAT
jgi:hypothetical protein